MTLYPTTIRLNEPDSLSIVWSDGHPGIIPLTVLRDACPCAGCKGETVLLRTYSPVEQPRLKGRDTLVKAEPVGHYALQVTWGDGHATGIYTWQSLRELCQCDLCAGVLPANPASS